MFSPNSIRLPSLNEVKGGDLSNIGYFDPFSQEVTLKVMVIQVANAKTLEFKFSRVPRDLKDFIEKTTESETESS